MLENLKERFGLASVWCADADGFSYRRSYTVDNNGSVDMGGFGACAVEYDGEGHEGGAAGVALQVIFVEQLPARSHVDNNVATDRGVVRFCSSNLWLRNISLWKQVSTYLPGS